MTATDIVAARLHTDHKLLFYGLPPHATGSGNYSTESYLDTADATGSSQFERDGYSAPLRGNSITYNPPSAGNLLDISDTSPVSHKDKRKSKRTQASVTEPRSDSGAESRPAKFDIRISASLAPASMSRRVSLLIASLGNPPPYHATRHSAAHIVLRSLQTQLSLPPFTTKSKPWASGAVSVGADNGHPEFTLWQSPVQMNVSGPSVLKAWKQHLTASGGASPNSDVTTGLVILHDEMETNPGVIKFRRGGSSSVKGHNGLKSVQASLSGAGLLESLGDRFVKVGVGIGRPPGGSRESRDVSAYVLGQVTPREKDGLERAVGEVAGVLRGEVMRLGGAGPIEF